MRTSAKPCLECGEKLTGRVDKKFCSDQCRITYNNRLHTDEAKYVKRVNIILRKNRKILSDLNTTGKSRVHGIKLKEKGFEFGYFTNLYKTKEGSVYHYCYDQGYLPLEKDYYLLVVKPDFFGER
jgi:predicted nucleic acid-binding Zn ribbon protein